MSGWVSIPNCSDQGGMMAINLDHVVIFYDLGGFTYEGDTEPTSRINVILTDGSKRVFNMTARMFAAMIAARGESIRILEEVTA